MKRLTAVIVLLLFAGSVAAQNQGPDAVPPKPKRNQPSSNGYYYAPDEGAKLPVDAWVEDDFGAKKRFVRAVITVTPLDVPPHHVTLFKMEITDSWYVQQGPMYDGKNINKSLLKTTALLEAVMKMQQLLLTTPPFPK